MNGPITESAAFGLNTGMLILNISGQGTISPNYDGQVLQIGKQFKIAGKPAAGFVLSNWTGGVLPESAIITNSATVSFFMQSNLVLQANFIQNPFVSLKGNFNGLFAETSSVHHASSGFISLSLTDRGTYSGGITIAGTRSSISGQFDLSGRATNLLTTGANRGTAIGLFLDITPGANRITGTVAAQAWSSDLSAIRAVFDSRTNPAVGLAGKYTAIIPGVDGDASVPAGDGYATLTVDGGGKLAIAGTLADGTAFRQAAFVSQQGDFPVYVPFSGNHGSLIGWLSITNRDSDDLHGQLTWTRLSTPMARFYALGFTNANINAFGSRYAPPAFGSAALNFVNASMIFSGGNLSVPSTNNVTVGVNNKITVPGSNNVSLTISAATGQITGTALPSGSAKASAVKGVALQKQNVAAGYMLLTNQSSRILISP